MEVYHRKFELIEECVERLSEIRKESKTLAIYKKSWKDKDSAERNLQKAIEAIIDAGKMFIAEKRFREPGNNREVFLILEERGLFRSEFVPLIKKMIGIRNIIVHSYDKIDDEVIYNVLKKDLKDIKKLSLELKKICLAGKP